MFFGELKPRQWGFGVVVGLSVFAVCGARADEPNALSAMLNARAALTSGRCVVRGTEGYAVQRKTDYELTFDAAARAKRFASPDGSGLLEIPKAQYVIWQHGIAVRLVQPDEYPPGMIDPYDIRGIGLLPAPTFTSLGKDLLDFDNLKRYLLASQVVEDRWSGDLRQIVVRPPKRREDREMRLYRGWINPHQGFSLVRWEEIEPGTTPAKVRWRSELEWRQRGDVWVPVAFRQQCGGYSVSWKLEWLDVNGPIDQGTFALGKQIPAGKRAIIYTKENQTGKKRFSQVGVVVGTRDVSH